jgi:hypothetical protein
MDYYYCYYYYYYYYYFLVREYSTAGRERGGGRERE